MSIGRKILLACLSLTLVTVFVGVIGRTQQVKLGATAFRIYDEAFMSMSYLRSAQNTLLSVSRDLVTGLIQPADVLDRIDLVLEDLDVVRSRAMSAKGGEAAASLAQSAAAVGVEIRQSGALPSPDQLGAIEHAFDDTVEVFAGDGYHARRAIATLVERTAIWMWAAIAASVAVALAITVVLKRAIVPSLLYAVQVAASIAAGRLDNRIEGGGRSETGVLLSALGVMQASIADKITHINAMMEDQASGYARETALQHARFEAALENMTQGLAMFAPDGNLLVHNRRLVEMFGGTLLPPLLVVSEGSGTDEASQSFTRMLEDGRTIAVAKRKMDGGNWVATYEDVTERQRVEARLSYMARHDALTGLPNRVLFQEQMEHALAQAKRGDGLAVLCLDIDNFKSVNDTLGHPIGDALLRAAANRLLDATRETDCVVRLGGDEFAIIQASAGQPQEAKALAERLVALMAVPFNLGDQVCVGVSIGIAITSDGRETAAGLLKAADLALYRAKADGRGTFRFFEVEMDSRMQARRLLEVELRQAVLEEQFEVYYQPLITIEGRSVNGFEALVRWPHPKRGMVSPGEFIPLAEEIGLISVIGTWVLNRACDDAVRWPSSIKVAVNLSPLQFRNRRLAADVASALAASGLPAERLELEITESLLLQDSEVTLAILHEIRALGVRISMDDFGTGYSSLSYLRRFPFDKIKIDQSFIRHLEERGECMAIVRAVVGLGLSLGMSVIAEGVETEEQLTLLEREGCQQVQGYLFSQPRPLSAIPALLERFAARRPMEAVS